MLYLFRLVIAKLLLLVLLLANSYCQKLPQWNSASINKLIQPVAGPGLCINRALVAHGSSSALAHINPFSLGWMSMTKFQQKGRRTSITNKKGRGWISNQIIGHHLTIQTWWLFMGMKGFSRILCNYPLKSDQLARYRWTEWCNLTSGIRGLYFIQNLHLQASTMNLVCLIRLGWSSFICAYWHPLSHNLYPHSLGTLTSTAFKSHYLDIGKLTKPKSSLCPK